MKAEAASCSRDLCSNPGAWALRPAGPGIGQPCYHRTETSTDFNQGSHNYAVGSEYNTKKTVY